MINIKNCKVKNINIILVAPYLNISLVIIKEHLLLQKLSFRFHINMVFMEESFFLCYHKNLVIYLVNQKIYEYKHFQVS